MGERITPMGAKVCNGGLISGLPPHAIGTAESPDCSDIDPVFPRGIRTRAGSSIYGVSGPAAGSGTQFGGLKAWTRNAGTTLLYAANATTVYYYDGATWNSAVIGMATDSIMQAAPLGNELVVVASGLAPQVASTGSTLVSIAAGTYLPSFAKYCTLYANKILIAGDPGNQSTVSGSESGQPEGWTAVNNAFNITVQPGDGDVIKGLEGTKRACYVFKRKTTYALTGDTTFNYRIDPLCSWGLVSEYAHCTDGQGCFFASDDGIYYSVGMNVARISDAIWNTYDQITDKSTIAMEVKGERLFIFYKGTSSSTRNDTALVCAYKRKMTDGSVRGIWAKYSSQNFSVVSNSRVNTLYAATNNSTLQVYQLDQFPNASQSAYWNTPDMDFGDEFAPKTLMRFFLHMQSPNATATINVTPYMDGSAGTAIPLTFGTAGSHSVQFAAGQIAVTGRFIRLLASWTGSYTIYGFQAFADVRTEGVPRR